MRICKYALLQIRIIANMHYCDPDSSPLSTSDSELCLSTLNSHTENWVWDYFQSGFLCFLIFKLVAKVVHFTFQRKPDIDNYCANIF